jgi:hypothetical protein
VSGGRRSLVPFTARIIYKGGEREKSNAITGLRAVTFHPNVTKIC